MNAPHVIIIGAGSTGAALAHDLALRGLQVTVIERAGVASGATGHNQAQLHSGARYAVTDPEAARECLAENLILRRIMPGALELNDGLFVAVSDEQLAFQPAFLAGCGECGIPVEPVSPEKARRWEPLLNPRLLAAVRVPDGVFDPYRLCLSFLATACQNGAQVRLFSEVTGLDVANRQVSVLHRPSGKFITLRADAVINAAGPWAGQVGKLGGLEVKLEASAGAMVTLQGRLCQKVLSLMTPPGDGDIIVPQRQTSILGTTSWKVESPDDIPVPPEHIELIYAVAGQLVPSVRSYPVRGVMAAARPLLVDGAGGRAASRRFACVDHACAGAEGFFSVIGGKTTTARYMAEAAADAVCRRLGWDRPCQTRQTVLLSHRAWRWG